MKMCGLKSRLTEIFHCIKHTEFSFFVCIVCVFQVFRVCVCVHRPLLKA